VQLVSTMLTVGDTGRVRMLVYGGDQTAAATVSITQESGRTVGATPSGGYTCTTAGESTILLPLNHYGRALVRRHGNIGVRLTWQLVNGSGVRNTVGLIADLISVHTGLTRLLAARGDPTQNAYVRFMLPAGHWLQDYGGARGGEGYSANPLVGTYTRDVRLRGGDECELMIESYGQRYRHRPRLSLHAHSRTLTEGSDSGVRWRVALGGPDGARRSSLYAVAYRRTAGTVWAALVVTVEQFGRSAACGRLRARTDLGQAVRSFVVPRGAPPWG
jgi:hypothetical protein